MRHAVSMLMYNTTEAQLKLSRQAFESIVTQDIGPMDIFILDNGSSLETGTVEWTNSIGGEVNGHTVQVWRNEENKSPVRVANDFLEGIFSNGYDKVLGCPSDIIAPRNLYRELAKWPRGIVTAHMSGPLPPDLPQDQEAKALHEDPHLSVMMVRKWAHDALVATFGHFFDPEFFLYVSDVDFKLRLAVCGIHGLQTDIMCWHYSSMWRLATPEAAQLVTGRAGPDREYFSKKWGASLGPGGYEAALKDVNFRG